jgi:hypothetical protein
MALTLKQINARIQSIGKSAQKLRDDIQEVAVSIIGHAFAHGDVTPAATLVKACGKSVDRQALVSYFEDMGCMIWNPKDEGFKVNKAARKDAEFDEQYVDSVKWYDYGRETRQLTSRFDWLARVESLLKQGEKKAAAGDVPIEHAGLKEHIAKAIASYHLEQAALARAAYEGGSDFRVTITAPAEGETVAAVH